MSHTQYDRLSQQQLGFQFVSAIINSKSKPIDRCCSQPSLARHSVKSVSFLMSAYLHSYCMLMVIIIVCNAVIAFKLCSSQMILQRKLTYKETLFSLAPQSHSAANCEESIQFLTPLKGQYLKYCVIYVKIDKGNI